MAFTQDQLVRLERAIASGALEVRYADRTVRYQSTNEMLKLRDLMRGEIQQETTTKRRSRIVRAYQTGKGV